MKEREIPKKRRSRLARSLKIEIYEQEYEDKVDAGELPKEFKTRSICK